MTDPKRLTAYFTSVKFYATGEELANGLNRAYGKRWLEKGWNYIHIQESHLEVLFL